MLSVKYHGIFFAVNFLIAIMAEAMEVFQFNKFDDKTNDRATRCGSGDNNNGTSNNNIDSNNSDDHDITGNNNDDNNDIQSETDTVNDFLGAI